MTDTNLGYGDLYNLALIRAALRCLGGTSHADYDKELTDAFEILKTVEKKIQNWKG